MAPKDMVVAFEKKRYGSSGDSRLDLLLLIQVSSCHKTVNSIRKPSQINLSTDYFSESKFVIFRHENSQKKRALLADTYQRKRNNCHHLSLLDPKPL